MQSQKATPQLIEAIRQRQSDGRLFNEDTLRWFKHGEELANHPVEGEYAPDHLRFSVPETLLIAFLTLAAIAGMLWLLQ
jgi:hypothetical protein